MAAEKKLQNKVIKYLTKKGCWYLNVHGGSMFQRAGVPDLIICANGRFIGLELKAPGGKPSELQKANIRLIKKSKGIALSSRDYNEIVKVVDECYE